MVETAKFSAAVVAKLVFVCGQRQGAEKRDQVDFYLKRGRGNIYPTDDYVTEHVMLANTPPQLE